MKTPTGLRLDNPAWPLLLASVSYYDTTTALGNALGTTVVCAGLANEPSYVGLAIKLLSGDAAGQVRPIQIHAGDTLTVAAAFTDLAGAIVQVTASTLFVIISAAGSGGGPPAPPGPGVSLWMFGVCEPGMVASLDTLVMHNLAGFNDDIFNNEFWIQVIHNANAPGTAPEREIRRVLTYVGATGTFTVDPFSANVEANDLVAVFHESIMAIEIAGYGTLNTSSATVPADSLRAAAYVWENNGYFDGCLLVPTEGVCRLQPRRIVSYVAATGVFTLDPNYPFSQAPGLVDYVIVRDQCSYSWPYIQALMDCMDSPQVDQANIEVARLSLHNLRPDDGVITPVEYAGTNVNFYRYRHGVDATWVFIVGAAMTEFNGFATYTYTFPAASWQDGDLIKYQISGTTITIPPGSAQVFYMPIQVRYGVVGGIAAIIADVAAIEASIDGPTGIFREQADTAVNINAIIAGETAVLNLAVANTRYIIRHLRLKCADPGANTVTVRLYELVNDGLIQVDSFAIDAANFATYHSLPDMWGLMYLAGDQLQVTVRASAGGPYVVTGQYSYAKTNN